MKLHELNMNIDSNKLPFLPQPQEGIEGAKKAVQGTVNLVNNLHDEIKKLKTELRENTVKFNLN